MTIGFHKYTGTDPRVRTDMEKSLVLENRNLKIGPLSWNFAKLPSKMWIGPVELKKQFS